MAGKNLQRTVLFYKLENFHYSVHSLCGFQNEHFNVVVMFLLTPLQIAQAAAYRLNIPVDYIKIRPNQNNVTPNPFITGGSTGSERSVAVSNFFFMKILFKTAT